MVLDDGDIQEMMKYINSDDEKLSRGGDLQEIFLEYLLKNHSEEENHDLDRAAHHIIARKTVLYCMKEIYSKKANETDKKDFERIINVFVNKDHTKKVLEKCIDESGQLKSGTSPGLLLKSAFCNNPHNLVRAPLPNKRTDDSGKELDRPILKKQSHSHRDDVDNFIKFVKSDQRPNKLLYLKTFIDLNKPNLVKWEKNGEKYKVQLLNLNKQIQ